VLPLQRIAEEFGDGSERFLDKGRRLGGEQWEHGDVSLKLFPFARVPVVLAVWEKDNEFPSSSAFLFDSSCTSHLPADVLWATAMMTVEMMLAQTV
jgi:hypothetical protein